MKFKAGDYITPQAHTVLFEFRHVFYVDHAEEDLYTISSLSDSILSIPYVDNWYVLVTSMFREDYDISET